MHCDDVMSRRHTMRCRVLVDLYDITVHPCISEGMIRVRVMAYDAMQAYRPAIMLCRPAIVTSMIITA